METQDTTQPVKASDSLPVYEPPQVVTHRGDELIDELGPAQACSFSGAAVGCD